MTDYASAIDTLVVLGILNRDFAANFRSVAGFRNILVHGYLQVDLEIVHTVLNSRLTEFISFADAVEGVLDNF